MEVNQFETKAFRKIVLDLFKIPRTMKENMTVSGTNASKPWNFVECAMANMQGDFTKIAVYYFYKRCEACDGIDSVFQPFLDSSMVGDSTSLGDNNDSDAGREHDDVDGGSISTTSTCYSQKKRRVKVENDAFHEKYSTLVDQGQMSLKHMEESANRERARLDLEQESAYREHARFDLDLNKDKFFARLEVAKAMNDYEELAKLKKEANEMPSGR